MPENTSNVVKMPYPKDSKFNRYARQSGSNVVTAITRTRRTNTQDTHSLLLNLIESGRVINSDSRSINYSISTYCKNSDNNLTLRKLWLIYKDGVRLNKINLSTASLLVQASSRIVREEGKVSRVYYTKAAHAYTLTAGNGTQRFYINLVHSLLSCGSEYLAHAYTQIKTLASISSKDKLIAMLDAAVEEYKTFGLRNNVVYADDQLLTQTSSTTEKHPTTNNVDPSEQILHEMAEHVDRHIKNYSSKCVNPSIKVENINKQIPVAPEKNESLSRNQEAVLLTIKQKQLATAIERAADEKNWMSATDIFDKAIEEIPNCPLIYNAMLLAADKCNCRTYGKILYVKTITDNFADINTHINALIILAKTYGELDWAWYAYSEIKRLGGLSTIICSLMITIARIHDEVYATEVLNDAVENGLDLANIIYDKSEEVMPQTNGVTHLEDHSAIHEVLADENSAIPQINITGSALMYSPSSSSLAENQYSLFGVRSSMPVTSQMAENTFSLYTL